ncbi:putative molybdopterin-guanine dinucleotide biosynthesis protein B [Proteus penneri ATCC 35198]|nr:putative molybdopterin-guanine dinucleotide biosynthesis protein B [Proteus penneri ATCC 35198]
MTETPELPELDLYYLASRFDTSKLDLILVEGFKGETIPKIALYRHINERDFNELLDEHVIAIASDCDLSVDFPLLDINAPEAIAEFIADWLKQMK